MNMKKRPVSFVPGNINFLTRHSSWAFVSLLLLLLLSTFSWARMLNGTVKISHPMPQPTSQPIQVFQMELKQTQTALRKYVGNKSDSSKGLKDSQGKLDAALKDLKGAGNLPVVQ